MLTIRNIHCGVSTPTMCGLMTVLVCAKWLRLKGTGRACTMPLSGMQGTVGLASEHLSGGTNP